MQVSDGSAMTVARASAFNLELRAMGLDRCASQKPNVRKRAQKCLLRNLNPPNCYSTNHCFPAFAASSS